MTRFLLTLATFATLAGCAPSVTPPPIVRAQGAATTAPAGLRSINYSTTACWDGCPVYSVTANKDGTLLWEGERRVAVTGDSLLMITPAQFAAFARALEPHRPDGERRFNTEADCADYATDMDGVDIRWTSVDGRTDVLSAYYGCDMTANRRMFDDLRAAVRQLPVAELIGADTP